MRAASTKAAWVALVILAAGAGAQEGQQAPAFSAGTLDRLPMDPGQRATLREAIGKRDYRAAEELLAGEAGRQPKAQPILVALANVLFLDGKHLNCAVVLKKAEKLGPLDERDRYLLALSYLTIGRLNWARPEFEALAQAFPKNAVYPYWLARVAYRKMDLESAVAQARRAVQLDAGFMKAHDQLGLCYEAMGKWEEAVQAFKEAVRLNEASASPSPWPAMNFGVLLLRLERIEEAEVQLRQSIAIDRRFPVAHHRLGQVLEKKQRLDDAISEFEEAGRLDPTYPDPHYALARILRQRGNTQGAEQELATFRELRSVDKQKGVTRPD